LRRYAAHDERSSTSDADRGLVEDVSAQDYESGTDDVHSECDGLAGGHRRRAAGLGVEAGSWVDCGGIGGESGSGAAED
jgi:hypothetical protein